MKLKLKLTKSEFDKLPEMLRQYYNDTNNGYELALDGKVADTNDYEMANKELLAELNEFKSKEAERIKAAEERAMKLAAEKYNTAKKNNDIDALEKSWNEKYEALKTQYTASEKRYNDYVTKSMIDGTSEQLANEISTTPTLIKMFIKQRLGVDFTGEQPQLYVKDELGQRSALTVNELKEHIVANKEFSAIIKANVPTAEKDLKPSHTLNTGKAEVKDWNKMSAEEILASLPQRD